MRLFLVVLFLCLPTHVMAEVFCDKRQNVVAKLKNSYLEVPAAMGLEANGTMMEIFVSPEGTWTISFTHPNGITCLGAVGKAWELILKKVTYIR